MTRRAAAFIHSPDLSRYSYPEYSPFKTGRAERTREILERMDLLPGPGNMVLAPEPADRADVEKIHSSRYLDVLARAERGEFDMESLGMGLGTDDCPVFKGMVAYAMLAAGASITGVKALLSGQASVAFNPSGGYHHAGPEYASGFCYINDVALACQLLAESGRRVMYLDLDVHHGDGVQNAFYNRRDVFTVSLHESGKTLFPGTGFEDEVGEGEGLGFCANVPLPVGTYDEAWIGVVRRVVMPLIRVYQPQALVVELGMDTLAGDPLAHLSLTNNAVAKVVADLVSLDIPMLATGGGGYNVENTARGWALCWAVLSGQDEPEDDMSFGMGGVMLQSSEWRGGLRDRALLSHGGQRRMIDAEIDGIIKRLVSNLRAVHGREGAGHLGGLPDLG